MAGYDKYMAQGPQSEFEMSRLDVDSLPLLNSQQAPAFVDPNASNVSLNYSAYGTPVLEAPPVPLMQQSQDYRQAPLHRPYPSQPAYPPPPQNQNANMAGRGAYRGY